jgi:HPt (histidine-containing phosphotransfer) domain-containing protein
MAEVIDVSQLETMTGGDAELAVEALGIFRQSAELWGRMLDPHAEAAQWADAAHGIKGAARSVGLMALGTLARNASGLAGRAMRRRRRQALRCLT